MSEFKLIKSCDIHTPLRVIKNGSILIQGEKIAKVGQIDDSKIPPKTQIFDLKQKLAVPGFIDIHLHGGGGVDFLDSSLDSIVKALKTHLKNGTTSLLPTIMTTSHKHPGYDQNLYRYQKIHSGHSGYHRTESGGSVYLDGKERCP